MSKLYINDLERIKNGKLVKYNFGYLTNNNIIKLRKLDLQINDLRYIRNYILATFKKDVSSKLNDRIDSKIVEKNNIEFDPRMLFLSKYLLLTINTTMGDTTCLVSDKGVESATFESNELEEKVELLLPYIKGILNLRSKSNVLDNEFYNDVGIYNKNFEKVLNLSGDGIVLPFKNYNELTEEELQELLHYYYSNWHNILENIEVDDIDILKVYRTNVSKQKALAIYKGIE